MKSFLEHILKNLHVLLKEHLDVFEVYLEFLPSNPHFNHKFLSLSSINSVKAAKCLLSQADVLWS